MKLEPLILHRSTSTCSSFFRILCSLPTSGASGGKLLMHTWQEGSWCVALQKEEVHTIRKWYRESEFEQSSVRIRISTYVFAITSGLLILETCTIRKRPPLIGSRMHPQHKTVTWNCHPPNLEIGPCQVQQLLGNQASTATPQTSIAHAYLCNVHFWSPSSPNWHTSE